MTQSSATGQTTFPPGAAPTSVLDGQHPTSFGGNQFPASLIELEGEQRDHIHEYPHRGGGAPEKLGRKLYTCHVRGYFHTNFPQFPDLYPFTIDKLQLLYEQGTTATFVHPSAGSYPAYIKKWNRRRDPRQRSGEVVDMVFQEDQSSEFLSNDVTAISAKPTDVNAVAVLLQTQIDLARASLPFGAPTLNLFAAIQTIANDISGIADTASLYGNLVSVKAQQLLNLCNQVDGALELQDARAYPVVDSVHGLAQVALSIQQDVQAQRQQLQTYVVPTTMPVTAIAQRLYNGDASRADDLLSLNVLADPTAVTAGTSLNYYPEN